MGKLRFWAAVVALLVSAVAGAAQGSSAMPGTEAETLTGRSVVLAEAARGHRTVLVMGFSREAGDWCSDWARALRKDPALDGTPVYEAAMLAAAPGLIRRVIKGVLRKSHSPAEQDSFLVFARDESAWRAWLGVTDDKMPYVVLLDGAGKVLWRGHGLAGELEAKLGAAVR